MDVLENVVQRYAWGSRTAIAELEGRAATEWPEAELWMGAHPSAPSRTPRGSLLDLIERAPEEELGPDVAATFGPRLPFLLKVLAAAEPLSLQAHPSLDQARAGFADEEARGVPRDAAHRNYKDANHKPELLCALGPFDALCGFRAAEESVALLESLAVAELAEVIDALRTGVRAAFERLMTLPKEARPALVRPVVEACRRASHPSCAWASRLFDLYPDDVGVVSALLLNLVHLEAGEAIYLPAGNLHAYLGGVGVEIMANSDNVLRGGLTPKHVDVQELLRVLDFRDGPVAKVLPRDEGGEEVWPTPAREFRLSRVRAPFEAAVHGPEIVLCVDGEVAIDAVTLGRGRSLFVPGSRSRWTMSGSGTVFRATVQRPHRS